MAGKRINLSDLADDPVLSEARVPAVAAGGQRRARLEDVASNPLNTRNITAQSTKIATIAESMRVHGQLQPCAVVSRAAFLAIFPEYESAIGRAVFVQVTGGRRRAAAVVAGFDGLDIAVKDQLAESRVGFLSATAAENIDREDLDPIEEAHAVELIVRECGSGKAAAERLARTPPWVTQRLNLLKLSAEVQALLRSGELPLREARTLHQLPATEQLPAVQEWLQRREDGRLTAVNSPDGTADVTTNEETTAPRQRASSPATAVKRLGSTPAQIADALRSALPADELRQLGELLLRQS